MKRKMKTQRYCSKKKLAAAAAASRCGLVFVPDPHVAPPVTHPSATAGGIMIICRRTNAILQKSVRRRTTDLQCGPTHKNDDNNQHNPHDGAWRELGGSELRSLVACVVSWID